MQVLPLPWDDFLGVVCSAIPVMCLGGESYEAQMTLSAALQRLRMHTNLLCASHPMYSSHGANSGTYLEGLLWKLNELLHVKH